MHCILRRGPQASAQKRSLTIALQTLFQNYFYVICLRLFVPQICRQGVDIHSEVTITYGSSHIRAQTSYMEQDGLITLTATA